MHSFTKDAQKSSTNAKEPPNVLRADKLDRNFEACLPKEMTGNNQPYKVKADEDGWKLEPELEIDVCENGQLKRYKFIGQKVSES